MKKAPDQARTDWTPDDGAITGGGLTAVVVRCIAGDSAGNSGCWNSAYLVAGNARGPAPEPRDVAPRDAWAARTSAPDAGS